MVHRAGMLPAPPTSLVGREGELGLIDAALAGPEFRLVTLTGPPGVGKTHLMLVAAATAASRFADGEVFVDLAAVRDSGSLLGEVARAVGSSPAPGRSVAERLVDNLADRRLLLVIDNCEHLLPAPELGTVLARCPQVKVLATSRERLHLAAEREITVAPLPVPRADDLDHPERVAARPAVRLLVERARSVLADFTITPENARDVADVCIRLDGLPLALELAAVHLKVFTPGELAYRLRHRSILLTGGRHDLPERQQSLRTAISWSYNLMPESERAFFRRLAVFVGGWTLSAADAVCNEPAMPGGRKASDATRVTTVLIDKSIIRRSTRPDGVTVFSMLESIRQYAAEQLAKHAEEDAARARHAEFYASLARQAESGIGTADEDMWWTWLGYEHGNLRAALDDSLARDRTAEALWLAAALGWYWYTRGYAGEGRVVVDRTLAAVSGEEPPAEALSAATLAAGILAWSAGEAETADTLLNRCLRMSEDLADSRRVAIASAFLGHVARDTGAYDTAARYHARARDIHERGANPRGAAWARFDLGLLAWRRGAFDEARRLLRESLAQFRGLDYPWAIAWSSWALAGVEITRGEVEAAAPLVAEALDVYDRLADRRGIAQCLELIAQITCARGQAETAGRLLGAAAMIRGALAAPGTTAEFDSRERTEAAVVAALGRDRAERAMSRGRSMPLSGILAVARRVVGPAAADEAPVSVRPTPREREVAALVAGGSTNREIGRRLGITEKTAEVHVRNLMGKLNARSRAEIAVWAVARGVYQPEDEST